MIAAIAWSWGAFVGALVGTIVALIIARLLG